MLLSTKRHLCRRSLSSAASEELNLWHICLHAHPHPADYTMEDWAIEKTKGGARWTWSSLRPPFNLIGVNVGSAKEHPGQHCGLRRLLQGHLLETPDIVLPYVTALPYLC